MKSFLVGEASPLASFITKQLNEQEAELQFPKDVKLFATGNDFTICVLQNSNVKLYGAKMKIEYLEDGEEFNIFPTTVTVLQVVSGTEHVLFLTDKGLWALGDNMLCQRAIDNYRYDVPSRIANRIAFFDNMSIKKIAVGAWHNLVLVEPNALYSWGINGSGQLGDAESENRQIRKVVLPVNERIIDMLADCNTSAVITLTADGTKKLYMMGSNSHNQCLVEGKEYVTTPTLVNLPFEFTSIAIGAYHTLFTTTDGVVYGVGSSANHELAQNGDSTSLVKVLELKAEKLTKVISCALDCYALSNTGNVYVWGKGRERPQKLSVKFRPHMETVNIMFARYYDILTVEKLPVISLFSTVVNQLCDVTIQ